MVVAVVVAAEGWASGGCDGGDRTLTGARAVRVVDRG